MKTLVPAHFVLCLIFFIPFLSVAQQNSGTGYYYDDFEYSSQSAYSANWVTFAPSTASTISWSQSSALDGSSGLVSVKNTTTPNSVSNVLTSSTSLNGTNANGKSIYWEWAMQYKFNSTTNITDVTGAAISSSSKNAWKFWIAADSKNPASCSGYYITQKGSTIVLVKKSSGTYSTILTSSNLTTGTSYNVKVQRMNTGSQIFWKLFVTANTFDGISQVGSATLDASPLATYTASILESITQDNTTANYFQWDDIKMYQRSLKVISNNNAASGVTQGSALYVGQTGVVLFSIGVTNIGQTLFNELKINVSTNPNAKFTNMKLVRSTDPYYSTTGDNTTVATITNINPTIDITGLSETIGGEPSDASLMPTVVYYFLVADISSSVTSSGTTLQFTFNSLLTSDQNYGALDATSSVTDAPAFTIGKVYDWIGSVASTGDNWNLAANWSPATVPGATDVARIGVAHNYNKLPIVQSTSAVVSGSLTSPVGSILMGNAGIGTGLPSVTVNNTFTLQVNGDISYQADTHAADPNSSHAYLLGMGTVTASNINVLANTSISFNYNEIFETSVAKLKIAGISLTTNLTPWAGNPDFLHSATFNITGGIVTTTSPITTTNVTGTSSAGSPASTVAVIPASGSTATLQLANGTALSGLSPNGTNVISFNNAGATVEYNGAAQTIYTSASITGLPGGVTYRNLIFSGTTGIKTSLSGTLTVSGDFTNNLNNNTTNYANLAPATVSFNGSTAQTLAGGTGSGTTFYTVNFSNGGAKTMSSGSFSVASIGFLSLATNNAVLNANGALTLKSDTTGTATFTAIPTGGTAAINGQVTVQRFVQGSALYNTAANRWYARNYRLLSSPVNEGADNFGNYPVSLNYLAASTIITDCTSAYGTTTGNPSLYLYNEKYPPSNTTFTSGNFIGVTNISNTAAAGHITTTDATNGSAKVYVGGGYMMYFRGDKVTHITGTPSKTSSPFVAPESVTFSTTGNLNQGTYSVVSWTGYGGLLFTTTNYPANAASQGFNLVGNPYASSIDWSKFGTSASAAIYGQGVDPSIYILNPRTGNWDSYNAANGSTKGNGSSIIPSGQGFFVHSNNHSSSLTFTEAAKSNTSVTGSNLLMGAPPTQQVAQLLRLKLVTDTMNYDDLAIGFSSTASNNYNGYEDSRYLAGMGSLETLYSFSADSIPLAINFLPLPKQAPLTIRLNASVTKSGQYTLERTALDAIPKLYEVWLMDTYKKDSLDIRNNTSYVFNIDLTDPASYGNSRFTVVIRENAALGVHLLNFTAAKATGGVDIAWKTENEENYTNFTVERSTDNGVTFDVLGGFLSNAQGDYTFTDKNPGTNSNIYRLKIEDINGTISYSKTVTITYGSTGAVASSNINVYPNPTNGAINLAIKTNQPANLLSGIQSINNTPSLENSNQSYAIKIVNITGTVVKSATSSQPTWKDSVATLQPGTYIIQVVNNKDKSVVGKATFVKM